MIVAIDLCKHDRALIEISSQVNMNCGGELDFCIKHPCSVKGKFLVRAWSSVEVYNKMFH